MGVAIAVVAREPLAGASPRRRWWWPASVWMLAVALFNIGVQLSAPRWVAGRSLARLPGGDCRRHRDWQLGLGASHGYGRRRGGAAGVAADAMFLSPLFGLFLRMPPTGARDEDAEALADPGSAAAAHSAQWAAGGGDRISRGCRSARAFHGVMQDVQLSRQRSSAYGWSIARDIADPELWTERYHCPTWLDFLRQRNRATQSERALYQRAADFHLGPDPVRVRRMLERPFGSVRWKDDTPDRAATEVLPVATPAGSSG